MARDPSRERLHHSLIPYPPGVCTARTYNGCFPLFLPASSSGGSNGRDYVLSNIMRNDDSVWCSSAKPPVYIDFESKEPVTLTEMIVRIPSRGYTCPARRVEVFVYGRPGGAECLLGPALATLEMEIPLRIGYVKHIFSRPIPEVRSILLVVRGVWGDDSMNVDLQYIAFGGYIGPHAFPSAEIR
jgi:hypothetical protein